MENSFIIFLGIAVAAFILSKILSAFRRISPQKANELVKGGALVIDVRQSSEYGSGHVKNAINIPLNNISRIVKKASKEKPIIVYCQSGARSNAASKRLKSMGYSEVFDMGGIHRWNI